MPHIPGRKATFQPSTSAATRVAVKARSEERFMASWVVNGIAMS